MYKMQISWDYPFKFAFLESVLPGGFLKPILIYFKKQIFPVYTVTFGSFSQKMLIMLKNVFCTFVLKLFPEIESSYQFLSFKNRLLLISMQQLTLTIDGG
jgi:hypothetical protein